MYAFYLAELLTLSVVSSFVFIQGADVGELTSRWVDGWTRARHLRLRACYLERSLEEGSGVEWWSGKRVGVASV